MNVATDAISSTLLAAVRKTIRPVIQLLMVNGVTFPAMSEMLKQVLVEVAEEQLRGHGQKVNDSRISLATGVHRKDVRRLYHMQAVEKKIPTAVSIGSRVVNAWLTEPRWRRKDGSPRVLSRSAGAAGHPSFEELASSVSNDVHPRAILGELLRIGVVRQTAEDRVALEQEAFIPSEGLEEKLYYLQLGAYSHLSASVHNVLGGKPAFFERIVHYESVPEQALAALEQMAGSEGMDFLKRISLEALRQDDPGADEAYRFSVGLYIHHEPSVHGKFRANKD